jgi:putative ABC transport system permease protein
VRRYLAGWRLALRLARRDLLKHRARAIIALIMVTLPVLAVVAADVLLQTAQVSAVEGIDRRIGSVATAQLEILSGDPTGLIQSPDPAGGWSSTDPLARAATRADVERAIGKRDLTDAPRTSEVLVATPGGRESVTAEQLDASQPLTRGLLRLTGGRLPSSPEEVVVNQALRDRDLGDTITVVARDGTESTRTVVGSVEDATVRSNPVLVGLPGSLPAYGDDGERWLVDGPPITWSQVQQLNELGVLVTDRTIASHPGDYPDPLGYDSGLDDGLVQVVALIVVMALIEVVLLAGPAIAVGARKQQHSLALLAASGGTPTQARRVILAGGVLLGLAAAVIGVGAGIGGGWLLQPLVQRFTPEWLGPFEVPWPHLAAVAAFGLASAFIACLVPAWIASRQNVVAVLAGRRGDAKPGRAFPMLGAGLFVVGVLMAVAGARGRGNLTVAWSAVVCVLGMVLLVPVVVSWVARVARWLPLTFRFAARDAVRHRTRTTPAVAAVAATVAGVVALGISTASDEKENRESYRPSLTMGDASVTAGFDYLQPEASGTDWDRVSALVREHAPRADVTPVVGVRPASGSDAWTEVTFLEPGTVGEDGGWIGPRMSSSVLGTDILVSDGAHLPAAISSSEQASQTRAALAAGRVVVFSSEESQTSLADVDIRTRSSDDGGATADEHTTTAPATVIYVDPDTDAPTRALLPLSVAKRAGLPVETVGLELTRPQLTVEAEKGLQAALTALPTPGSVYVERGYQADSATVIVQWVLAGLGAILMVGGTLTASFLALSDARPDLATLSAVGATPWTRRGVAAAYTFLVGSVGAVLGMLVGFVPGLAITWPLTDERGGWCDPSGCVSSDGGGPFIEIPWPMIATVVVGLPLFTALVVGLCTRSRLPLVSRLS